MMTGEGLLYSVALQLTPVDAAPEVNARRSRDPSVVTSGYQAYGLVLRLLAEADPALAQQLHDDSPRKPLTVSELQTAGPRAHRGPDVPALYGIRVTLLEERAFAALAQAVLDHGQSEVAVGDARYRLVGLLTMPGSNPQVRMASFAGLLTEAAATTGTVTLRLLSPAVFRSGGDRNLLFPEPGALFSGLLDKWNAFCPPAQRLALDRVRLAAGVHVQEYRLETQRVSFGSYSETGATGWVRYRSARILSDEERQAVRALAAFASFAGVGAKTTMGLGQTSAQLEFPARGNRSTPLPDEGETAAHRPPTVAVR